MEPDTLVLRQSSTKVGWIAFGSVILALGSLLMALNPEIGRRPAEFNVIVGWCGFVFFGVCCFVCMARLDKPSELHLTATGLELRQWSGSKHYSWSSVREFFVWEHQRTRMAALRLHDNAPEMASASKLNQGFGLDGSIGNGWDRSPEDIVELLRSWKARHAPGADGVSQAVDD